MRHSIKFLENEHIYTVDGIKVPSVTWIIRDPDKFKDVDPAILNRAADRGTAVHKLLQDYNDDKLIYPINPDERRTLDDWKWIRDNYGIKPLQSEAMVVVPKDGQVAAAGRLDAVAEIEGKKYILDYKTTSTLDRTYLWHQLNLYKAGYEYTYDEQIDGLAGIWINAKHRAFYEIKIKADPWEGITYEQPNETYEDLPF